MPSRDGFQWRGFERPPKGALFEQIVDVEGPMGVAYERSVGYVKALHAHDRLLLVCPRGATTMAVGVPGLRTAFRVTSRDVLLVPARVEHDDHHVTRIYDTFALLPSAELLADAVPAGAFPTTALVTRSPLLEELLQEYFIDRVLSHGVSAGRRHVEALILHELHRAMVGKAPQPGAARSAKNTETTVARALQFIEANLFEPLDIARVARAAGASRSALLRHFRDDVGETVGAYIQGRRLDDARSILRTGDETVARVAALVGYRNAGAFTEAYRRRFGEAPSRRTS